MLLVFLAALLATQPGNPTPAPTAPPLIEVRYADGSTMRHTPLGASFQFTTRHGPLTIPWADLRRVELGLHFPEGTERRVASAVQRLGAKSFREREDAAAELLALGEYAFPAVAAAAKSADLEVAQRAEKLVTALRERLPQDRQRLDTRDRLETTEGTFAGRIVGPAWKARNAFHGDVELRLSDLRSLRCVAAGSEAVSVDAAKYGGPGAPWLDTGIEVEAGRRLVLEASGQVDLWPGTPGQYTTGPAGFRGGRHGRGWPAPRRHAAGPDRRAGPGVCGRGSLGRDGGTGGAAATERRAVAVE